MQLFQPLPCRHSSSLSSIAFWISYAFYFDNCNSFITMLNSASVFASSWVTCIYLFFGYFCNTAITLKADGIASSVRF